MYLNNTKVNKKKEKDISKLITPYSIVYLLLNLLVPSNIFFFFLVSYLFDKNKREEVMKRLTKDA